MLKCSVYCIQREIRVAEFLVVGQSALLMWGSCKCFCIATGCLLKELKPVVGHGAVFFSEGWRKNLCRCDSCQVRMHHLRTSTAFIRCFGGLNLNCALERYTFAFMTYCHVPFVCCHYYDCQPSGWTSLEVGRGIYVSKIYESPQNFLVARWMAWSKFHAEGWQP